MEIGRRSGRPPRGPPGSDFARSGVVPFQSAAVVPFQLAISTRGDMCRKLAYQEETFCYTAAVAIAAVTRNFWSVVVLWRRVRWNREIDKEATLGVRSHMRVS